jgi:hypothetical protein
MQRYGTGAVATALTREAFRSRPRMAAQLNAVATAPVPYRSVGYVRSDDPTARGNDKWKMFVPYFIFVST